MELQVDLAVLPTQLYNTAQHLGSTCWQLHDVVKALICNGKHRGNFGTYTPRYATTL